MKRILLYIITSFVSLITFCQTDNEFWFVAPKITVNHFGTPAIGGQPIKLVMTNGNDTTAYVTISMPANPSWSDTTIIIKKMSTYVWVFTHRISKVTNDYNFTPFAGTYKTFTGKNNRGLYIVSRSDPNLPNSRIDITVYYEEGNSNNPETFSFKGRNALGTRFFTSFQTDMTNKTLNTWTEPAYSAFDIVFTEDNTYIDMVIPTGKFIYNGATQLTGTVTLGPFMKGETYSGVPARADAIAGYNYKPEQSPGTGYFAADKFGRSAKDHLAGVKITTRSGKKIAVTLKDDSMKSLASGSYDLGGDQTIPVDLTGTEYIAMKGQLFNNQTINGDYYKPTQAHYWYDQNAVPTDGEFIIMERLYILAVHDGTTIKINGHSMGVTLNSGQQYTYPIADSMTYAHVQSSDSVYVLQVTGFGGEEGYAILPAINTCTGSNIVGFSRSTNEGLYLSIMVRTTAKDGFLINGKVNAALSAGVFIDVPGSSWSVARLNFTAMTTDFPPGGTSMIQNTKDVFHLEVINGGSATGTRSSYFSNYNVVNPYAYFSESGSSSIRLCYSQSTRIYAKGGVFYNWNPANYLSDPLSDHPIASPPYNMTYIATVKGYCNVIKTTSVSVQVAPPLHAQYSLNNAFGCAPINVQFQEFSQGASVFNYWYDYSKGKIPDLSFSFPDNKTEYDTTFNHTFINYLPASPDTFKIFHTMLEVINTQGCRDSLKRDLSAFPTVTTSITTPAQSACDSLNVSFTHNSVNSKTYSWEFGDVGSSNLSNPTHLFRNFDTTDITYSTRLIAISKYNCRDTAYQTFTVHPHIDAQFTVDTTTGCADFPINIHNSSIGGIWYYNWDFDDGQTSTLKSPLKTYFNDTASSITRQLKLIVKNKGLCRDSIVRPITVLPKVTAAFTQNIDQGCNPLAITFTPDNTNKAIVTYKWDFGDGITTTKSTPVVLNHTYNNINNVDTKYKTRLTVTSSDLCTASAYDSIIVYARIHADFSVDKVRGCSGFVSTINNLSSGGISNYYWDLGDTSFTNLSGSQPAVFTHSYITNSPKNYMLQLRVDNSHGCTDSAQSILVSVFPGAAALFSINDSVGCVPFSVNFINNTDTLKTNNIKWEFGDGTSSFNYNETHIYNHTSSKDSSYIAKLIATSSNSGCVDTTIKVIMAYAYVNAGFSVDSTVGCSPLPVIIQNNSIGGISQYNWKYGDNTFDNHSLAFFPHSFINNSNNPASVVDTLKLIVQNSHGCRDSFQRNITIYPEPKASFGLNKLSDCTPLIVQFSNLSNSVATNFNWDFGDGNSSGDVTPIAHSYNNLSNLDSSYHIILTTLSQHLCKSDTTINITAYSYIHAGFALDSSVGCSPLTVTIHNNSSGGISQYNWNYGDNFFDNNSTVSFQHIYSNKINNPSPEFRTLKLVVQNSHGCKDSIQDNLITIFPEPIASFSLDKYSDCNPLTIQFSNLSNNVATNFSWDFGDGNSSNVTTPSPHFYNNLSDYDSTYHIKLNAYSQHLCKSDTTLDVTAFAYINAIFSLNPTLVCSNTSVIISNSSNPGVKHNYWDFKGDGSGNTEVDSSSFHHTFTNTIDTITIPINVRLIVQNNHACYDSAFHIINVKPQVVSAFIADTMEGCQPLLVNFTNLSNIRNVPGTTFSWDFGDATGSSAKDIIHIFSNPSGNDIPFPVKLKVTSPGYSCSDDTTININAYAYVKADFNLDSSIVCANAPLGIKNNSSPGVKHSYWDINNDGMNDMEKNSAVFYQRFTNSTSDSIHIKVRLVTRNNHFCYDTAYKPLTINPLALASFVPDKFADCQPVFVNFTNNSNIATAPTTLFNWNFADGTSDNNKNTFHTFYNFSGKDSVFPVKLTITSQYSCADDTIISITAYSQIKAGFSMPNSKICSGDSIEFYNGSSSGSTHRFWYFKGTGMFIENDTSHFKLQYINTDTLPVVYNVRLKVSNNHVCYDSIVHPVTIYPQVISAFTADKKEGCQPLPVKFTNKSNILNVPGTKYFWNFGDGNNTNDTFPNHVFEYKTNTDFPYKVILFTTSDNYPCTDSSSMFIKPYAYIKANFALPLAQICSNNNLIITNNAQGGVQNTYWDYYGDGSKLIDNSKTLSIFYSNYDTAVLNMKLKQTVENSHGCSDTLSKIITIFPKVFAGFFPDTSQGCQPLLVHFMNNTNLINTFGTIYKWDFGDGNSSTDTFPPNVFKNLTDSNKIFNVRLIATSKDLCNDSAFTKITAFSYVHADFKVDVSNICSDLPVNITDASPTWIAKRYWDYESDYKTDTLNAKGTFKHTYANTSNSQVIKHLRLIASNKENCLDSAKHDIVVYPRVVAKFSINKTIGCNPLPVNFTDSSVNATIFNWDFGDGNTSKVEKPFHTFNQRSSDDTTFNVKLHTQSQFLCESYDSVKITVYPYVKADFKVPQSQICSGFGTKILNASKGGITRNRWDYESDGIIDATNKPDSFILIYTNLTNDKIVKRLRLIVNNKEGCIDSIGRNIEVFPKVTAGFNFDTAGCHPFSTQFNNTTNNGNTFNWFFGDGSTSSLTNPKYIYTNYNATDTSFNVKLVAVSNYLCSDSVQKQVYVYPKPKAQIAIDKNIDCPPFNLIVDNNTITSKSIYYWNLGNGELITKNDKGSVNTTYYNSDNFIKPYKITFKALTDHACSDTTSLIISVYPKVTALFDTVQRNCNPIDTVLINHSINATDYLWDFGDSSYSNQKSPSHLFFNYTDENRIFVIKLIAMSEFGCNDSTSYNLVVFPAPKASFSVTPTLQYFPNATFIFKDLTNKGPWIYNWDFDDGQHSVKHDSVSHTYVHWGKFDIKLIASNNGKCIDTAFQNIVLLAPKPIADFDSSASGCTPITVYFKNKSIWGEQYLWEFDDGTQSTSENPSHTFIAPDIYNVEFNVKLTVVAEGGTDFHYERVTVFSKPKVDFDIDPTLVMLPDDVIKCFNTTQGGKSYQWDFGDGSFSVESNPVYKYKKMGFYTVKLTSWSENDCSDSLIKNNIIEVSAKGKLIFPNAFIPSMSGPSSGAYNPDHPDNKVFFPYNEGVAEYHLEIYNRWGELIFVSENIDKGWDGYYKGQLCKQDVYVYKATGKYYNGKTFVKAGDVTLLQRSGL